MARKMIDRLSPEDRTAALSLHAAETTIKRQLAEEVHELVACIRQFPEITERIKLEDPEDEDPARIQFAAHLIDTHIRRIAGLDHAMHAVLRAMTTTVADGLIRAAQPSATESSEVHHA